AGDELPGVEGGDGPCGGGDARVNDATHRRTAVAHADGDDRGVDHGGRDGQLTMILAATEDGIRDVERGGVTFGDRDVTHLVAAAGGLAAIVDRQQVLHAAAGETWRPVGRIEGPAARCVLPRPDGT